MPKPKRQASVARDSMTALGVYKSEFEPVIKIYGALMEQYDFLNKQFIESNYPYSEDTKDGTKKAPIVTTLEALRKDILSYAAQLGLTPQGLLKVSAGAFEQKSVSTLASALAEIKRETGSG